MLHDPVNLKRLRSLCRIQCTYPEIAAVMGVDLSTVEKWAMEPRWRTVMEAGKRSGFVSLRRAQFKLALAGNATMQIWLGKQLLGQKDETTIEHTGKIGSVSIEAIDQAIREAGIGEGSRSVVQ